MSPPEYVRPVADTEREVEAISKVSMTWEERLIGLAVICWPERDR